jgi:hypothetical protein
LNYKLITIIQYGIINDNFYLIKLLTMCKNPSYHIFGFIMYFKYKPEFGIRKYQKNANGRIKYDFRLTGRSTAIVKKKIVKKDQ